MAKLLFFLNVVFFGLMVFIGIVAHMPIYFVLGGFNAIAALSLIPYLGD